MSIQNSITSLLKTLPREVRLVAVSKTQPNSNIEEAYAAGQRIFGENKAQELPQKYDDLPKDIEWHMIGHMQTNKIKYIAPFVTLIHSVDSVKVLEAVNKHAAKADRIISCLLQVHIADEETKFGFDETELRALFQDDYIHSLAHIKIAGLMGMATNTEDEDKIRSEFRTLKNLFSELKKYESENVEMKELSMGMSSDYAIAVEEGSTLIRVGSAIFGNRNYSNQ